MPPCWANCGDGGEMRMGDSHAAATRIAATVTTTERRESTWNNNLCVAQPQFDDNSRDSRKESISK